MLKISVMCNGVGITVRQQAKSQRAELNVLQWGHDKVYKVYDFSDQIQELKL